MQTADNLTGDYTFGKINAPVIKDYTTTETTAGGATVTKTKPNTVITVTYTPNGHIIPVGPDGKPIPDAPQPQFPTNPDNPNETTSGQVPDVPSYHPETGKPGEPINPVPGKPGEDVPVKYVPDVVPNKPTGPVTPKPIPEQPASNSKAELSTTPNKRVPSAVSFKPVKEQSSVNTKKAATFPQTGRKENQGQLIGLALAGLGILLGLVGDRKKKNS
ncbi:mucin-binding protein [Lactobacillus taiwanensis]|uniref:mucin-binding protein n=1 Tax=Lactobacillus taiwanensis TaxID=508451 RepID=UPI003C6CCD84